MSQVTLSSFEMIIAFIYGSILSAIYLGILWTSIRLMAKVKHKGLFLFMTAILRLFIFIFGSLVLSQHNAWRFLLIVVGFLVTRLIIVALVKHPHRRLHD